jgi:ADP-heptose:LPS heptosyltransferase
MTTWPAARRIVAVRLDAMGDVLMTTPAIRALHGDGEREITLLTSASGAAVAPLVPEIADTIVYDAPWMKASAERDATADLAMIEHLRSRSFDAAVIFTVYSQNPQPAAFLCSLAGIPLRLAHSREPAYRLLTDRVPEREPDRVVRHEVRRQLDLVETVGFTTTDDRLSLRVSDLARRRASRLLAARGVGTPWFATHVGSTAPSRRYEPASFARAIDSLAIDHGWTPVFVGTHDDAEAVRAVRDRMRASAVSLVGELDLEGLAAVLALAPVLIANNSGPVHVAAAVGTPVVDLYALTNPQHTPWGVPSRVLYHDVGCRFCYASVCPEVHHDCLRLVPPQAVVDAALELVSGRDGSRASVDGAGMIVDTTVRGSRRIWTTPDEGARR